MRKPAAILTMLTAAIGLSAVCAMADSVFDTDGLGGDVIQSIGATRALGGAVVASSDPLSASIMNPAASALATGLTISTGFAHVSTSSDNLGEDRQNIRTLFPTIGVVVPFKRFSLLTGLYVEKQGRISLADTGSYATSMYDVSYSKETSTYSVPLLLSSAVNQRFIVSAGVIFSFHDTRERTVVDFISSEFSDTDDAADAYAVGESFALGMLVDLGRLRVAGVLRSKSELDGNLDRSNKQIGIWRSEDIEIASHSAFRIGVLVKPVSSLSLEADFDRTPWSRLHLNHEVLTDKLVERFAVGLQYSGDQIWKASRHPINLGYYRQPLDWETSFTGEITEEVFSIGTAFPMAQDRARASLALEIGTRKAANQDDLKETTYGFSLSISATEVWRREVKK